MKYSEMIDNDLIKTKPIKIVPCSSNGILKLNADLVISYLLYKFINMEKENSPTIDKMIFKPEEIINNETSEVIEIGSYKIKMFNEDKIFVVVFQDNKKQMNKLALANLIVNSYFIVSKLFVKTRIRYISRNPAYVAFESYHVPQLLVSLRELITKVGVTNDSLFHQRVSRILKKKQEEDQDKSRDI